MLSQSAINTLKGCIFKVAKGGAIESLNDIHHLSLALRGLEIEEQQIQDREKQPPRSPEGPAGT